MILEGWSNYFRTPTRIGDDTYLNVEQKCCMFEQPRYVVQVWDEIGVPCDQRKVITKDQSIGLARSTAQDNSFETTVFYDGAVIARFDNRPTVPSLPSAHL